MAARGAGAEWLETPTTRAMQCPHGDTERRAWPGAGRMSTFGTHAARARCARTPGQEWSVRRRRLRVPSMHTGGPGRFWSLRG
eukprot:4145051-Pleurochrysis_carterae.AAC.4